MLATILKSETATSTTKAPIQPTARAARRPAAAGGHFLILKS
jgi:hypothetical protein